VRLRDDPNEGNGCSSDVTCGADIDAVSALSSIYCDCSHQGDCTDDGMINPSDVIFLINYAFRGGPPPPIDPLCRPVINRGDWDCNARIDISDVVKMVSYVYRFPAPGPCDPCP